MYFMRPLKDNNIVAIEFRWYIAPFLFLPFVDITKRGERREEVAGFCYLKYQYYQMAYLIHALLLDSDRKDLTSVKILRHHLDHGGIISLANARPTVKVPSFAVECPVDCQKDIHVIHFVLKLFIMSHSVQNSK